MMSARGAAGALPVEGMMPPLDGATQWLNSAPLTREGAARQSRARRFLDVLLHQLHPRVAVRRAWHEKYRDQGLVVIGIHSPEFAFEKRPANVEREVARSRDHVSRRRRQRLRAVARVRERVLAGALLRRCEGRHPPHAFRRRRVRPIRARDAAVAGGGRPARPRPTSSSTRTAKAPRSRPIELERVEPRNLRRASRAPRTSRRRAARSPASRTTTRCRRGSASTVGARRATGRSTTRTRCSSRRRASIVFRFQARDLHLVLGPGADGKPVRFRVRLDGAPPGDDHGTDVGADGSGTVDGAAALSAHPPVGRSPRPDVRDRVLGSRRDGVRFHVRLTIGPRSASEELA